MTSDRIVIQSPMSYSGSARRIWRITRDRHPVALWLFALPAALLLVPLAWVAVTGWYVVFGLLVIPYRLVRRGGRKRRLADARHQETLAAIRDRDS